MEIELCTRSLLNLQVKIYLILHLRVILYKGHARWLVFRSKDQTYVLIVRSGCLISVLERKCHRHVSKVHRIGTVYVKVEINPLVLLINFADKINIGESQDGRRYDIRIDRFRLWLWLWFRFWFRLWRLSSGVILISTRSLLFLLWLIHRRNRLA